MEKSNIGLGDKYNFGVELEFSDAEIDKVSDVFLRNHEKVFYSSGHKQKNFDFYGKACLDLDASITTMKDRELVGGEVSSKIMCDRLEDWEELSRICHILKDNGATTNEYCSTHITVDISKYKYDPKFFEMLYKLLLIYENEIILFLMGEKYLVRKTLVDYAEPMRLRLLHSYPNASFETVTNIIYGTDCFSSRDGVNCYKVKKSGLIEFRYPNGTLDVDIIQNNVNFVLKLIDAITSSSFDYRHINYLVDYVRKDPNFVYDFVRTTEHPEFFDELISTISTSWDDFESFDRQYKKVIGSRNSERNFRIE